MAKVTKCNQCKAEIEEYVMYLQLEVVNAPTTFAEPYTEKHFCTKQCLVEYFLEGKSVSN